MGLTVFGLIAAGVFLTVALLLSVAVAAWLKLGSFSCEDTE